jgi:hypothetical protein
MTNRTAEQRMRFAKKYYQIVLLSSDGQTGKIIIKGCVFLMVESITITTMLTETEKLNQWRAVCKQ